MKKIKLCIAAACTIAALTACQQKGGNTPAIESAQQGQPTMNIAYVDVDTLMTKYVFWQDNLTKLEEKSAEYAKTLESRGQSLQQAAMQFQEKIQTGVITTEKEALRQQENLQRQQENLQKLEEELMLKLTEEQNTYSKALRDSISNFLAEYNKAKKFTMIISKSGDNILYADSALNITNEVVNGLNKRYTKK